MEDKWIKKTGLYGIYNTTEYTNPSYKGFVISDSSLHLESQSKYTKKWYISISIDDDNIHHHDNNNNYISEKFISPELAMEEAYQLKKEMKG